MEEKKENVFWWGVLGFIVSPMIALILYLVFKEENLRRANAIGIGGIVAICLIPVIIITIILSGAILLSLNDTNVIDNSNEIELKYNIDMAKTTVLLFKTDMIMQRSSYGEGYDPNLVKLEDGYVYYDTNDNNYLDYNEESECLDLSYELINKVEIENGEIVVKD